MSNNFTKSGLKLKTIFSAARNVFEGVVWLPSIGLWIMYPARWLTGDSLLSVRMTAYIFAWYLFLFIPLLFFAWATRRKWLGLTVTSSILIIVFTYLPLYLPNRPASSAEGGFSVKIMSYNLHGIPEIDGIVEVIRRENPDVLLIQECSPALCSPLYHGLDDLYPYKDMVIKDFGQAAYSRYPMKRTSAEANQGRTQKLIIKAPQGPAAVWNIHPIPPFLIPPQEYDAQMSALVADIAREKGPLIVAGDLNATDQSEAYRKINQYLIDGYWETGWGVGFSYPAPPYTFMDSGLQMGPIWRIDHIFHSSEFTATDAYIVKDAGGSDHFPIVVVLSLK